MLAMVSAQPWPVSPRPCRKMTVAECLVLGLTTTGCGILRVSGAAADLDPLLPIQFSKTSCSLKL